MKHWNECKHNANCKNEIYCQRKCGHWEDDANIKRNIMNGVWVCGATWTWDGDFVYDTLTNIPITYIRQNILLFIYIKTDTIFVCTVYSKYNYILGA